MTWVTRYLGAPYLAKGCSVDGGIDCWGLVVLVYRDLYQLTLPMYGVDPLDRRAVSDSVAEHVDEWHRIVSPNEGSLVLFRMAGSPAHVGVMIDRQRFIHSLPECGVVVESLGSVRWNKRVDGFYEHRHAHYETSSPT